MRNWDDARVFVALALHATSRGAADALGLNQSTVSRRLAQLEQEVGTQLFDRRPSGLQLNDAGAALLPTAERIAEEFVQLERQMLGQDARLSGRLRLSLPDLAMAPFAPALAAFCRRYPEIVLEPTINTRYVRLTHREADVALRLAAEPPGHLVGRRIARARLAVYGAAEEEDRPLAERPWIRWDEPFRGVPMERWIDRNIPPRRVHAHVDTSLAAAELIAVGVGVGFLLCFTGDRDPRLVRVAQPQDFGLSMWLLTHEDIRRTARIRAFMREFGAALAARRAAWEGTGAGVSERSGLS